MKKFYILLIAITAVATVAQAGTARTRKAAIKEAQALEKPGVLPATNISEKAFTANWQAVNGAEGYAAQVFSKTVVEKTGTYTVLDEDFSGIIDGSLLEPLGGDEDYVNLDDYKYADNAGWSAYAFPNFVPSMVAGLLYSPYLNLTNNDGKYKLVITTYSTDGDIIRVVSHGKGEKITTDYTVSISNGGTGSFTKELEFENGCEDLFFSIINLTAEVGSADYTDRVQVIQDLKEGDVYYKLVAINESIEAPTTSARFTDVTYYADGATTLYYNVSAGAYNFSDDAKTYEYVQSPYSDYVMVDLTAKTSEIVEPDPKDPENPETPENGELILGHYDGSLSGEGILDNKVAYDGANWYNAPMAFTYRNSGSQNIYFPSQLASIKDTNITSVSFSCIGVDSYSTDDYRSTAKLYISEVDANGFYVNPETEYSEWFNLDQSTLASTKELELDFLSSAVGEENINITFELDKPFKYTGKTLLITVTNESDSYLDMGEYVRFYWIDRKAGEPNQSCTFVNDNITFLDNLAINKRITSTDNFENINYNAPAVKFTFAKDDSVELISRQNEVKDNAWYTIMGVRVNQPTTPGIYIHNGKKYIVR